MADLLPPVLAKPIPPQIVNEGAAIRTVQMRDYIQSPNKESGDVYFFAELEDGRALPQGLICTSDGMLSGIPAVGTQAHHKVIIVAENDSGIPFTTEFELTIKERISIEGVNLKSQVWEALKQNLPLPEFGELLERSITAVEIYYLLERFATLTIWDVYNLDTPAEKNLIKVKGLNKHYQIWDRGSCLVAGPVDLFSHERTLEDALQASRFLAQEAYSRGWVIEFAGFDKMVRAAWVELRLLGERYGKQLEILHYIPTNEDIRTYEAKLRTRPIGPTI